MMRVGALIIVAVTLTAAQDTRSIRICVGSLENRSSYQLPIEKLKMDFASQLTHQKIKAINLTGQDLSTETASNNCDYLVSGAFTDFAPSKRGAPVVVGGVVVDGHKRFVLRFSFDLKRSGEEKSVHSYQESIIDKNPKTCADDHIWEAVRSIREYFKRL